MGVYIEGLKMPPEGTQVRLGIYSTGFVNNWNGFGQIEDIVGLAVETPERHGRLIDADMLIAYCEYQEKVNLTLYAEFYEMNTATDFLKAQEYSQRALHYTFMKKAIEKAPTVIPATP